MGLYVVARSGSVERDARARRGRAAAGLRSGPGEQATDARSRWVELIPLTAGRLAVSTGMVDAAGPRARELTDRLRQAGRDCAERDLPPGQALTTLDGPVRSASLGAGATAVHLVHDSAAQSLSLAHAGRWPPALVTPRGATKLIPTALGPPLGVGARGGESVSIPFPRGSSLVLCLHAVACPAGRPHDDRLVTQIGDARLSTRGRMSIGHVCEVLVGSLGCGDAGHETTIVIAQARDEGDPDHPVRRFPPSPSSAGAARAFGLRVMDEWQMEEKSNRVAVIIGELAANAIQHTSAPFEVRLHRSARSVLIEVIDLESRPPNPIPAEPYDAGHRGLTIVETLADRWGTRLVGRGKVVWAELHLDARPHDIGLDPPTS